MIAWNKDVLHLIFQNFVNGYDMLNFSEISRGCNKVFHQNIEIVFRSETQDRYAIKFMRNNQGHVHGIRCSWYTDGMLRYRENYYQDMFHGKNQSWFSNGRQCSISNYFYNLRHGIHQMWYQSGKPWFKDNYFLDQQHGMQEEWLDNSQRVVKTYYHHGTKIEK